MANEEKMKVLKMIQDGKITAEEGAKLLEALDESSEEIKSALTQKEGKTLKIKVTEKNTGVVKVNLSFPVGIARFVKNFIPPGERIKLENMGINLDSIFTALDSNELGKLVEVEDEHENVRIEIWIE